MLGKTFTGVGPTPAGLYGYFEGQEVQVGLGFLVAAGRRPENMSQRQGNPNFLR